MRTQTKTSVMKLAAVGAVAGLVSGLVKLGWENILPPRTPERDKTNPPQTFLQQHGLTRSTNPCNLHLFRPSDSLGQPPHTLRLLIKPRCALCCCRPLRTAF